MGCFSRKILLTVNDYNITLSRDIKLYQNDAIELCFTILQYETTFTEDDRCIHELIQLVPLKAYMLIESPEGEGYVEATSIRSNEVVFRLSRSHTNFAGIGHLQIVLKDANGCRITLPSFSFEIKESINPYWVDDDEPIIPEEPIEEDLYMYYGRLSIDEVGGAIIPYSDITSDMIINGTNIKKEEASVLDKTSMGLASDTSIGDYVVIAVPSGYTVTKDNGIGGKVVFNEVDIAGANGIPIIIDDVEYMLYGETLGFQSEIFIYVD